VLIARGGVLDYETSGASWAYWVAGSPRLTLAFSIALVLLTAVYAWATVAFGLRFSNLTHRGILTHGPYRWTKHPAYLSKNLFWWLSALPLLTVTGSTVDAVPQHRAAGGGQRDLLLARAHRGAASVRRSRLSRLCRVDGAQRAAAAAVAGDQRLGAAAGRKRWPGPCSVGSGAHHPCLRHLRHHEIGDGPAVSSVAQDRVMVRSRG
jgi:hypothetical protein